MESAQYQVDAVGHVRGKSEVLYFLLAIGFLSD